MAHFYILRLQSGRLYVGATRDLDQRLEDHVAARACRTTKIDSLVELAYSEEYDSFKDALQRESQVKRWSAKKKEALIGGDFETLHQEAKSHDGD